MSFSELMQFLADNYTIGIPIFISLLIGVYLLFSIRLIITSRREGLNICVSAMIPVYSLILWVRKCIRKRKNNKKIKPDAEIIL